MPKYPILVQPDNSGPKQKLLYNDSILKDAILSEGSSEPTKKKKDKLSAALKANITRRKKPKKHNSL